ncbi:hypothetical protein BZA70DRAFT_274839 [Myxozyma melibiosi]|uniref:Uncharacterized protein n=1 Tax=Myxozyma melibiosi TaxID=54550 RepID=A0ABR1FA02_9ASCO
MNKHVSYQTTVLAFISLFIAPWLLFSAIVTTSLSTVILICHIIVSYIIWIIRVSTLKTVFSTTHIRDRLARTEIFIAKLVRRQWRVYHVRQFEAGATQPLEDLKNLQQKPVNSPPSYAESERLAKASVRRIRRRRSAQCLD